MGGLTLSSEGLKRGPRGYILYVLSIPCVSQQRSEGKSLAAGAPRKLHFPLEILKYHFSKK